jgi:hypothetical protein
MKRLFPRRGAEHLFNVTNLNKHNENVTNTTMYGIMLPAEGLCTYDTQFFSSCCEQAMKKATPYV